MTLPKKDIVLVTLQFTLLGLYFIFNDRWFTLPVYLKWITIILGIFGLFIIGLALLQLNRNLSPFPTPKSNSSLVTTGLYSIIRHPIYSGIILSALSVGLYFGDLYKIGIAIILYLLFEYKAGYEEHLLQKKFTDYAEYKKSTGKIIPFI